MFCFFRQIIVFGIFFGIFESEGIPHFREKRNIRKGLGRCALYTCAKFHGLSLNNGVDIWIFVWQHPQITVSHRNYVVSVEIRFWAFYMT